MKGTYMITQEEQQKRRKAIESAKASVELERIIIPSELMKIAEDFIEGKYTREEFTQVYIDTVKNGA